MSPLWSREEFEGSPGAPREPVPPPAPLPYRDARGEAQPGGGPGLGRQPVLLQQGVVVKDAILLSKLPSREERRIWIRRVLDQGRQRGRRGGLEDWLRLAAAVGLSREETLDGSRVVPGVRFAVDAYIRFCDERPWPEGSPPP